jgi:uncharacterized protein (TIGR02646 family)
MKQVVRPTATPRLLTYLTKRQDKVTTDTAAGTLDIEASWKTARKTKTVISGLDLLRTAMGATARCMYCVDSEGTDIDHFRPKAAYHATCFDWLNMVLCCTPCGRIKGEKFPMTLGGAPLLVNPLDENPWESLSFDPVTGNITTKYDPITGLSSPKGDATVEALRLDRREAVAAGYKRTMDRIDNRLGEQLPALAAGTATPTQVVQQLRDIDDHFLLEWCFSSEGATYGHFHTLSTTYPALWLRCVAAL